MKAKKKVFTHRFCAQTLCPSYKGGDMPQFCILFCANYTILATKRWGAWPKAPPKYAPGGKIDESIFARWIFLSLSIRRQHQERCHCNKSRREFHSAHQYSCHLSPNTSIKQLFTNCFHCLKPTRNLAYDVVQYSIENLILKTFSALRNLTCLFPLLRITLHTFQRSVS